MTATFADALRAGPVLLDGGLATTLEAHGHDLSGHLWSARLLRDAPAAVVAVHRAFLAAGARVLTTASYQATPDGFAAAGLGREEALRLVARSVELARRACADLGTAAWVAGSVGPYGASLADGSEYRGDDGLSVAQLRAWHRPRIETLAAAGADLIAAETVPSLREAEALVAELDRAGVPGWLALTCAAGRTRDGAPAAAAFGLASGVDAVVAVGVNCCAPAEADRLTGVAAAGSGKPVVVYPNSGEAWDAEARRWTGDGSFDERAVTGWVADGARLIGGCCRVGPERIAAIGRLLGGR